MPVLYNVYQTREIGYPRGCRNVTIDRNDSHSHLEISGRTLAPCGPGHFADLLQIIQYYDILSSTFLLIFLLDFLSWSGIMNADLNNLIFDTARKFHPDAVG